MTSAFSATTTFYIGAGDEIESSQKPLDATARQAVSTAPAAGAPHLAIGPIRPLPVPIKPIVAPTITQTSEGVLAPNPTLGVLRPIGPGWGFHLPMPRSRYALPTLISPVAVPDNTTLFEEPQDGTKKHLLRQYEIATQGTTAQPLYWISLAPAAPDFALTVHLAAASVQGTSPGTTPVAVTSVSFFLSATVLGRVVTWPFTVSDSAADTLTLVTKVTGKPARDTLYHAMTDPAAGAQLIIRSAFSIASFVPVAPPVPRPGPPVAPQPPVYRIGPGSIDMSIPFTFDPDLNANIFSQITNIGAAGPSTWSHQDIVWNQHSYSYYFDPSDTSHAFYLPDAFRISRQTAAPHAPSLQISMSGSDPSSQSFVLSFLAVPTTSMARLQDAISKLSTQYGFPANVQLASFEASKTSLALTLPSADGTGAPGLQTVPGAIIDIGAGISGAVTLSPSQLQQVYSALFEQVSGLLSGVVTVTINATDTSAPTIPFSSRAGDFAGDIFTITTTNLPGLVSAVLVNAIESPIHISGIPLALQRNGTTVTPSGSQISPPPPVDLAVGGVAPANPTGIGGGGTDPTNLGGTIGGVIGGIVGGDSGNGGSSTNPTGGVLGGTDGSTGTQIGGILGGIFGGIANGPINPAPVPPAPTPTQPTAPAGPVQSLNVILNLPPGGTNNDTWTVLPDYTGAQVTPDQGAIWDAIMSNQVLSPFKRPVRILALTSLFQPPVTPPAPADPNAPTPAVPPTIVAAQVVFSTGETADFNSSTPAPGGVMTETVSLSVPLRDYILQTGDTSSYKYRVDLVTATGITTGQWQTSNQDSFFVQAS